MRFWCFMVVMDLMIPLTMIGLGSYFKRKPPKNINYVFGYRTPMSMINKETWKFAHHYAGKIWLATGWVTLAVTVVVMLILLGQDVKKIALIGGIICLLQCIPLIAVIIPTEIALRKKFDKYGNERQYDQNI